MDSNFSFKKINNESYESLEKYINKALDYISKIEDPYFITCNNEKFFVTGNHELNVLVNDKNIYGVYIEEDEYKQYLKNSDRYIVNLDDPLSFVVQINLLNDRINKLQLENYNNEPHLYYSQQNIVENQFLDYEFDLTKFSGSKLQNHLSYIYNSHPDIIKKKVNNKISQYILSDHNSYSPFIKVFKNNLIINSNIKYRIWELFPEKTSFYNKIPVELVELLNNSSREFNDIYSISNVYKKVRKK